MSFHCPNLMYTCQFWLTLGVLNVICEALLVYISYKCTKLNAVQVISNAKKFTIASDSQHENISLVFKNYTQVMKNILKYPWYPMFVLQQNFEDFFSPSVNSISFCSIFVGNFPNHFLYHKMQYYHGFFICAPNDHVLLQFPIRLSNSIGTHKIDRKLFNSSSTYWC